MRIEPSQRVVLMLGVLCCFIALFLTFIAHSAWHVYARAMNDAGLVVAGKLVGADMYCQVRRQLPKPCDALSWMEDGYLRLRFASGTSVFFNAPDTMLANLHEALMYPPDAAIAVTLDAPSYREGFDRGRWHHVYQIARADGAQEVLLDRSTMVNRYLCSALFISFFTVCLGVFSFFSLRGGANRWFRKRMERTLRD